MAYRRFYIEKENLNGDELRLHGDLVYHIRDVCRFKTGDRFEVLAGDGKARLVEIIQESKNEMRAREISTRELPPLEKPYITLCLSVPKLPKVDWIVEKAVELGAYEVRPFVSDYSFLRKASELSENRLARWRKLAQGATQQSGRGDLMRIGEPTTLEKLLQEFSRNTSTMGLFPYEGDSPQGISLALESLKSQAKDHLWVFIGSEGGFSPGEVALFALAGLQPTSLGVQILRVETACLAVLSIIKYEFGDQHHGSIRRV